ncbi:CcdC protein domain-containing protein [Ammoniphilus resinae]|uniref:Uncharacterized protein n=1 Tax=Ammoniphilus resinae TaxID=861532 RepID=A0ABS4GLN9_9BACL|nr:CcdC protein domain-containing protein [Ammoniphilus resinae]MBP1931190.1 hypothetical protein [Ammoniphilus resinae]
MFFWLFLILLGFVIYRKVKRAVGMQIYRPVTICMRLVLLLFTMLVLVIIRPFDQKFLFFAGLGCLIGLAFLTLSVKHTRFYVKNDGLYYKNSPYISFIILVIVLVRAVMKIPTIQSLTHLLEYQKGQTPNPDLLPTIMIDPISGLFIFMMITYFIGYNIFIYKKGRQELV